MALDLDAVRAAYAAGPSSDKFVRVPTREERVAESERELFRLCIEGGRDPEAECLGQHGALIGGSSKPGRTRSLVSRLAEDYAPVRLAPPSWFGHNTPTAMSEDGGRGILAMLVASYMAGAPKEDRPTPEQMRQAFYADPPSGIERFWLHEILACARIRELRSVIQETGMSLGVFVRSLHNADVRRHDLANWMNQFAVAPEQS